MPRIFFMFLSLLPIYVSSQEVTNIQVTQKEKMVIINYDLKGDGVYDVRLFYSTNDGQTWNEPLKEVLRDVGMKQTSGIKKEIIWNVLEENLELYAYCKFKVEAISENNTSFKSEAFTDERDGQVYKWVKIGDQIWMAENLKTEKYTTDENIPLVTGDKPWKKLKSGGYCWYDNDVNYKNEHGALYNWNAVNTGKLCPIGWHVPTDEEWSVLERILGDVGISKERMKYREEWINIQNEANTSGFFGLSGGNRKRNGEFYGIGQFGIWWSSFASSAKYAVGRDFDPKKISIGRGTARKNSGFSVRCVKD